MIMTTKGEITTLKQNVSFACAFIRKIMEQTEQQVHDAEVELQKLVAMRSASASNESVLRRIWGTPIATLLTSRRRIRTLRTRVESARCVRDQWKTVMRLVAEAVQATPGAS